MPFSLPFRGPRRPSLLQGVYPLDHPQVGAHEIFIVPVRADAQGLYYEAVFG
jgi:hypothetical protein